MREIKFYRAFLGESRQKVQRNTGVFDWKINFNTLQEINAASLQKEPSSSPQDVLGKTDIFLR
ncbi:MAG: hypothetical protein K6T72_15145 [Anoxybacillus sp.]|nr:hypothetical protein [Anoxybacillus sp.]MCL6587816.1 hypothetical protein [Anoxybacillus sp.]